MQDNHSSLKYYIATVLLIVILASGGYYYYQSLNDPRVRFEEARDLYKNGENAKSAQILEEALAFGFSNKEDEAHAKLLLSDNYLASSDIIETGENFTLLKEIVSNPSYPNILRGISVLHLAEYYSLNIKRSTLYEYIFTDEPYISFVEGGDLRNDPDARLKAMRNLYGYALEFDSLPAAEFRLAQLILLEARRESNLENKKVLITEAKDHIEKGSATLHGINVIVPPHADYWIGYANWLRGKVYDDLSELEENPDYIEKAESSFVNSMNLLETSPRNIRKIDHSLWARLYYASFLYRNYGESKRTEIESLLNPISALRESPIAGLTLRLYLKGLVLRRSEFAPERVRIMELANFNSEFKEFLIGLGWEF